MTYTMTEEISFYDLIYYINNHYIPFVYKDLMWNNQDITFDDWWIDTFIQQGANLWTEDGYDAWEHFNDIYLGREKQAIIDILCVSQMLAIIQQYFQEFNNNWTECLMEDWHKPRHLFNIFVYCHFKLMDLEDLKEKALQNWN